MDISFNFTCFEISNSTIFVFSSIVILRRRRCFLSIISSFTISIFIKTLHCNIDTFIDSDDKHLDFKSLREEILFHLECKFTMLPEIFKVLRAARCGNFAIFLQLRFSVKSILTDFKVSKIATYLVLTYLNFT